MTDLALFFGANSYQTATNLYLFKSDFNQLTPLASNTPRSLFVALTLHIADRGLNDTILTITVESLKTEFVKTNNKNLVQNILIIKVFRLLDIVGGELRKTSDLNTPSNTFQ